MVPAIENLNKLNISPENTQVLRSMFAGYRRVIIRKEFGYGLSGSRVIEVRPIKADGIPELPVVVKLATISLIQKEWQAYQQHIHRRLPYRAEIRAKPVLLPDVGWGGLRYTLMGGSTFEVVSLGDYCRHIELSPGNISTVLRRLLRIMDNLWGYNYVNESFYLQPSYEHLLPVSLLIRKEALSSKQRPHLIQPNTLPTEPIKPGDYVRASEFVVHKVNPMTQTMTLRRPIDNPHDQAYYLRYKSPALGQTPAYQANQMVDSIEGRVIETQMSRLQDEVSRAFGDTINPASQAISLVPWSQSSLRNPLVVVQTILQQSREVNISAIHGDFNFENILVEPETGSVSVIDFAEAREDHILHDLLRLETEVLTKLIPEILHRHNLSVIPSLVSFYWQLHATAFHNTMDSPALPHPDLEKSWMMLTAIRQAARKYFFKADDPTEYYQGLVLYLLGALKFKNLNDVPEQPLPKQSAFWAATVANELLTNLPGDSSRPPSSLEPLLESQPIVAVTSKESAIPLDEASLTLAEAEQRFAALPLDTIPTLAPLPPHSRMPLSRNPLFVGRKPDLRKIAYALKGGETLAIGQVETAATTGLGGMGKTQLASEFVHRYGQFFAGGIYWLSFADPKAIPAEIAACGGVGAMELRPNFGELSLEDQVNLVMASWQEQMPRLLIFDNCEDPQLLAQWRPPSGGCRILITTRRADWEPALGVQSLPLDVLKRQESVALLQEHRADAAHMTLDAIAQELGDLPLALHLAGSYLARYRRVITPVQYLEQLRDPALLQHPSLKGIGISPTGHSQNVRRAIALSHNQLDPSNEIDNLALRILVRAASLAPGEPIPYRLLRLTLNLDKDDLDLVLQVEDAVTRLVELGLLRLETNNMVRVHRLVAAFVRDVNRVEIEAAQRDAISAVYEETLRINKTGNPTPLLAWHPHLRIVTDVALRLNDEQGTALCNQLGRHLVQIGDYEGALPYYEAALQIRRNKLGEEHPDIAECLMNIGYLLKDQGKLIESRPYLEKSLHIRKKMLGEDHPTTAKSYNEMGRWFLLHGDLNEARDYLLQAVRISRKVFGDKHRLTADYYNNLGLCLEGLGDMTGAMQYFEQALGIRQQILGRKNPRTALSLNNMGYLLRAMERLAEAQPYYEEALAIRLEIFGEEHPDTGESLNNLGELLRIQGNFTQGRLYLERALAVYQNVWGEDHPDTAYPLNTLGLLLQDTSDLDQARTYLERALAIRQKVLKEDHPLTALSYHNLGLLMQAQGDLSRARESLECALIIRQKAFGDKHTMTAKSMKALGLLLKAQGNLAEAKQYLAQTLEILEDCLGPDHADTAVAREYLASINGY